jgi:hypothetical protein
MMHYESSKVKVSSKLKTFCTATQRTHWARTCAMIASARFDPHDCNKLMNMTFALLPLPG